MSLFASSTARIAAVLAAVSFVSTPALAASLPVPSAPRSVDAPVGAWSPTVDVAHDRGWGRHHHDEGIDGGDLLAGILILGGIAAIASAASSASKHKQSGQSRYEPPRYPSEQAQPQQQVPDYRDPAPRQDWNASADMSRLDDAADACVDAVSSRGEVDHVYRVDPSGTGSGYRVAGDFTSGKTFACEVNGDRVDSVNYGDRDDS